MQLKNREKTLKWIDLKHKQNDGVITGELPEKETPQPLATIIPIKDTINFSKQIVAHHSKLQKDISSCLRGTKLNKYQKSRESNKGNPLSSSQGMAAASAGDVSSTNQRKQSGKLTKADSSVVKASDDNSLEAKKSKDKDSKQPLNFY